MKLFDILLEGFKLEKAKRDLDKVLDQEMNEENDSPEEVKNLLKKYMEEIGDDPKKLQSVINFAATTARKDQLTTQAIDRFFKSDFGQRLLSDKAKEKEAPTRGKDRRIELVKSFDDITDAHVSNKTTVGVLKMVFDKIIKSDFPYEVKEKFIDDISDKSKLIPKSAFLQKNASGNIKDLVHKDISSSPLYDYLLPSLFHAQAKSVGKGEALFILYGQESGDSIGKAGDVMIDGTAFEVKNSIGDASIDTALPTAKFNIDTYNKEFLKNTIGLNDEQIESLNVNPRTGKKTGGQKIPFDNKLIKPKLTVDNLTQYFERVYNPQGEGMGSEAVEAIAKAVYKSGGSNSEVAKAAAPYVYNFYKKQKGFEAIIFVKPDGSFISFKDDIPKNIKVSAVVLTRGGNTQSLPLGYVNMTF